MFYSSAAGRPINQSTVSMRFRGYLADAGIPHFAGGPHPDSLRHGFAVANLRRWAADNADLAVMLPYLACYMGHADLRGTQYYLRLTADAYPEVMTKAQIRFGYVIPAPTEDESRPATNATPGSGRAVADKVLHRPPGRERAAAPRTIDSYRDAIKLLLIWFKDAEHMPPERLRLVDIDRPRILRFLDWLVETEAALLGGHPQPAPRRDQVVLPLHRRRAARPSRPGHPSPRDPAEEDPGPGPGGLTGDEVKTLLAEPGTATTRAIRDTVLIALAYDTAARVQESATSMSRTSATPTR